MFRSILISTLLFAPFSQASAAEFLRRFGCRQWIQDASIEARVEDMEKEVRQFHPDAIPEVRMDLSYLKLNPAGDRLGGAEGDVIMGEWAGREVVVKFIRSRDEAEDVRRIKQSFFTLYAVHQLELGPEPYGYITGSSLNELAQSAGLTRSYSGAIVMERIRPTFHKKAIDGVQNPTSQQRTLARPIPYDKSLAKKLVRKFEILKKARILPNDVDFMIDQEGRFLFVDLDMWLLRGKTQLWYRGGVPQFEARDQLHRDVWQGLFGISNP